MHICEGYRCVRNISQRSFQYKFFMRNLATKRKLKLMGITSSDICGKCKHSVEDIVHMFWSCIHAENIWKRLHRWLEGLLRITFDFDIASVLLHIPVNNLDLSYYPLLTTIYILVKQTIYYDRLEETPLSFQHIISSIKYCERMERYTAQSNKKMQQHLNKWLDLYLSWRE